MENIKQEEKVKLFFEAFMTSQMENLDKLVKKARKDSVSERYIENLEKSFEEFSATCNKLFAIHGGEFCLKLVCQAIPDNLWARLNKKALGDPEVRTHLLDFKKFIIERGISKEAAQQIKEGVDKKIKGVDFI